MRLDWMSYILLFIVFFLFFYFFDQRSKMRQALDTIQLQHEAILKQQEYIEAQKRYIYLLELQSAPPKSHINPKSL